MLYGVRNVNSQDHPELKSLFAPTW
jgi:hypothetical protein